MGCYPWGRTESGMTAATLHACILCFRHCSRHKGCNDELNKDPALMELVFPLVKTNTTYIYTHMYTNTHT